MASITAGRHRQCKRTIGGVRNAYLAPFKKVLRNEIVYDGVTLLVFPETEVFKFEIVPGTVFEQKQSDSEGGKYYDINLSIRFNKITAYDNQNISKLLKKDYFVIIEDNLGNFFLTGFRNGVTADSLKSTTTQYTVDFAGKEEELAPFVTGLMGNTFITAAGGDYIFQDRDNYIFQDNTNYIFQ